MKILKVVFFVIAVNLFYSCLTESKKPVLGAVEEVNKTNIKSNDEKIKSFETQMSLLLKEAESADNIPRTVEDGEIRFINNGFDWTEGFFPGTCWYLYEVTKDEKWRKAAEKFQAIFEDHKLKTTNHDLGFVFNCSYGNGLRLTNNDEFAKVLVTAADSLSKRFNPIIGAIKSWDVDKGWQAKRGWKFPVIIDNMMNLELLFKVSQLTGDSKYKEIAITHANTTLKNHFRDDNSSYHVVDYDPETGAVRSKQTAQGYSDDSAWARGQAWGIYGYTMCYRFTQDEAYLNQAKKIANFIVNYPGTPKDGVPYWDYNAPNIPNEPRDVSAAAITLSALIELNQYTNNYYKADVDKLMTSLASKDYTAKQGENHNFVLKHSVGSIPHNNEIDVPLNYADYYYLEALLRYKKLNF